MTRLPALLGGQAIFAETIPVARPALPNDGELATPLAEIIASRIITKGRHVRRFEEMVARHLGVTRRGGFQLHIRPDAYLQVPGTGG